MEPFIRIREECPQLGIANLTTTHCQCIRTLLQHTQVSAHDQHDVRSQYRALLAAVKRSQVSVMPELNRHVGVVHAERYFPELMLDELAYAPGDPSCIGVPPKHVHTRIVTWKHRTLIRHVFADRLYQCSDSELADARRIFVLTLGRCGDILGSAETARHDRSVLLALYAATLQLEAEMRSGHERFAAHISGTTVVNRHRIRLYTSALEFCKSHTQNLLRICPMQRL